MYVVMKGEGATKKSKSNKAKDFIFCEHETDVHFRIFSVAHEDREQLGRR